MSKEEKVKMSQIQKDLARDAAQLDNLEALEKNWKFKKKIEKAYPHFVESLNLQDVKSLEYNLMMYAKQRGDMELALQMDKKIKELKEKEKEFKDRRTELEKPYKDSLKNIKDKLDYILLNLKERKGEIDTID
jgi:hypothetical protein